MEFLGTNKDCCYDQKWTLLTKASHFNLTTPHERWGLLYIGLYVDIVKYVHLVIFTFSLTAPVPVRFPLQCLASIVRDIKSHPHSFFTFRTTIILLGIQALKKNRSFQSETSRSSRSTYSSNLSQTSQKSKGVPKSMGRFSLAVSLSAVSRA